MARASRRRGGDKNIDTRQALLDAVLELMNRDKSFDAMSLREVTREVGITPAAFYRHFPDMDSLGLELVSSSFRTLRELLKTVRQTPLGDGQIVRRSVETFVTYVRAHRRQFQFITRERFGGVAVLREEIDQELRLLGSELATDLARFPQAKQWSNDDLQMAASLMIGAMIRIVEQLLMARRRGEDDKALIELGEKQLRLIVLGALQWRSSEFVSKS